ncbi:membrane-spanning 4-domains subfamily A member 4A-like [Tautogolabrus adspersus]
MSVTDVKDADVTLITVATDSKSMLPPLCQVLKALCNSPKRCRVTMYEGMMQTSVTAALGVIQIMVGLFNIGLGSGRISQHPEDFAHLGVAFWLGGVFLLSGLVSVLAGRFSSFGLVGFAVFMNIVGFIFSIVGIVMYSNDLREDLSGRYCDWNEWNDCRAVLSIYQRLLAGVDITMIVLLVLLLCVCISFVVLGIKALIKMKKKKELIEGQWYKWTGRGPPKGVTWTVGGPNDPLGIFPKFQV